jgi:hypothetical protein
MITFIYEYENEQKRKAFYSFIMATGDISAAMKYYNDYDTKNYLITFINTANRPFKFDEELYEVFYKQYYEYYSKNPFIKLLIYTRGKNGAYWCKTFLKFFNTIYYVLPSIDDDINFIFNGMK